MTETKAKPYVCTTCTRPFARLEHLKRHERSHTKEKPFVCDQAGSIDGCGRRFARRDLLLRHQQKIHLFPSQSKRRRLSSSSTASTSSTSSAAATQNLATGAAIVLGTPPTIYQRVTHTMSIPAYDDLSNFVEGTINPSSLLSPNPITTAGNEYLFATERLLSIFDSAPLWAMPSGAESVYASDYSPASSSYGSLSESCIMDAPSNVNAELFHPSFFTSATSTAASAMDFGMDSGFTGIAFDSVSAF